MRAHFDILAFDVILGLVPRIHKHGSLNVGRRRQTPGVWILGTRPRMTGFEYGAFCLTEACA